MTTSPSPKLVLITGGVCSSLGKGIASSSLGRLLTERGLSVLAAKMDPYLGIDPGTLSPSEHGEVFVTATDATGHAVEADLDLGTYERFLDRDLPAASSVSAGRIYQHVLNAERRGDFLGQTVQTVPHIVDEVIARIDAVAPAGGGADVVIVEIGGTVGDMEIVPFLEAIRRIRHDRPGQTCLVHLGLVPEVGPNKERKTKPLQHSVALLRSYGLSPDVILARSTDPIGAREVQKLSRLCGLSADRILPAADASSIYLVPRLLAAHGFDDRVAETLGITAARPADLNASPWAKAVENLIDPPEKTVRVGIVAKYTDGHDTYLSVEEALRHAAAAAGSRAELVWIDAEAVEADVTALEAAEVRAIVVPGGFGERGTSGKVAAARWARENDVAYLGLCLGLQVAVIDFARHVAGIDDATSAEWGSEGTPVITHMDGQGNEVDLGGTMRLGSYDALVASGSQVAALYGRPDGGVVTERHRHRLEVNPRFHSTLTDAGLVLSGLSPDGRLVEHIELPGHRFWVATQAHPEFLSRPGRPHPLFVGLIAAS